MTDRNSPRNVVIVVCFIVAGGFLPAGAGLAVEPRGEGDLVAAISSGHVVDLTHPFDEDTIYWPNAPEFRLIRDFQGVTERGYYYTANQFAAAEHGGTHIDSPIHFYENRETVDAIPLGRLIGAAAVVDVSGSCAADRDHQVSIEELRGWEQQHGRSLEDMIVLLRTGFDRYWPDREAYLGTAERGEAATGKLHFPGLDPVAARWLAEQRRPKLVGIDTASIDNGPSRLFQSHVTLFKNNVPALENVANLDNVPAVGATVIALPMKIAGGSGGPTRIVAIVPAK
ncbi:MAG: cyclase family protein [Pirellulales bacterium]|nr:cyclase family protein [Planctomycetales bacterium]